VDRAVGNVRTSLGWGILVGVPALFASAVLYPMVPARWRFGLCAVKRFAGVECPGCGLRSSFTLLAHGRVRESIDSHPLGVVIAAWLIYLFAREVYALLAGRRAGTLLTQPQRDLLMWAFLVALVVQWIAKLALA
jgi:hypothetical protein